MDLCDYLDAHREDDCISMEAELNASREYGLAFREVEEKALQMGLMPLRYERNRRTISVNEQLELLRSRVAVIGCGGLGGYCVEELARLGVGTIVLVDPAIFKEHNLNRQILSSCSWLGTPKVHAAARMIGDINPAVTVMAIREAFTRENGKRILEGVNAVLDGLDTIDARQELAEICAQLGVPFIHGAIGGWYGQVLVQQGGENRIQTLFGREKKGRGLEQVMGTPAFTPAVVASIQVAEACKVLLARGPYIAQGLLTINLLDGDLYLLSLEGEQ